MDKSVFYKVKNLFCIVTIHLFFLLVNCNDGETERNYLQVSSDTHRHRLVHT